MKKLTKRATTTCEDCSGARQESRVIATKTSKKWGSLSATNPVAQVPDLSTQNKTFLMLRSGTSGTRFVAERVPHCRAKESLNQENSRLILKFPTILYFPFDMRYNFTL